MNSTSKLFFSSLTSKSNLPILLLMVVFFLVSLAGIGLVAMGMYELVWHDPLFVAAGSAVSLLLTVIFALRLAYSPLISLSASLEEMEVQNRHNQDAILQLLDEMVILPMVT